MEEESNFSFFSFEGLLILFKSSRPCFIFEINAGDLGRLGANVHCLSSSSCFLAISSLCILSTFSRFSLSNLRNSLGFSNNPNLDLDNFARSVVVGWNLHSAYLSCSVLNFNCSNFALLFSLNIASATDL